MRNPLTAPGKKADDEDDGELCCPGCGSGGGGREHIMKPEQSGCPHPYGTENVIHTYRTCDNCGLEIFPEAERCSCGSADLGPVIEECICSICEHTWRRIRRGRAARP